MAQETTKSFLQKKVSFLCMYEYLVLCVTFNQKQINSSGNSLIYSLLINM